MAFVSSFQRQVSAFVSICILCGVNSIVSPSEALRLQQLHRVPKTVRKHVFGKLLKSVKQPVGAVRQLNSAAPSKRLELEGWSMKNKVLQHCPSDSSTCNRLGSGSFGTVFDLPKNAFPAGTFREESLPPLVGKVLTVGDFCRDEGPVVFGEAASELCMTFFDGPQNWQGRQRFQHSLLEPSVSDWEPKEFMTRTFGYGHLPNSEWVMVVMEKAGDKDLSDFIEKDLNKMKPEQKKDNILTIMRGILSAVEYVHSRGIIVTDIKPQNLMVTLDPEDKQVVMGVKLIDFGLFISSKIQNAAGGTREYLPFDLPDNKGKSKCGNMLGWDLPSGFESLRRNNSKNSDLFAVGVVFLQLLGFKEKDWKQLRLPEKQLQLYYDKNAPVALTSKSYIPVMDYESGQTILSKGLNNQPVVANVFKDFSEKVMKDFDKEDRKYGQAFVDALGLLLTIKPQKENHPETDSKKVTAEVREKLFGPPETNDNIVIQPRRGKFSVKRIVARKIRAALRK